MQRVVVVVLNSKTTEFGVNPRASCLCSDVTSGFAPEVILLCWCNDCLLLLLPHWPAEGVVGPQLGGCLPKWETWLTYSQSYKWSLSCVRDPFSGWCICPPLSIFLSAQLCVIPYLYPSLVPVDRWDLGVQSTIRTVVHVKGAFLHCTIFPTLVFFHCSSADRLLICF